MDSSRRRALEANIWKMKLWEFLTWAIVFVSIFVPYMHSKGMSLVQIFVLQTIFALCAVVLELPTGYYADVHGRKQSLIWGTITLLLGWATYLVGSSFAAFSLAAVLVGIGVAFNSGAQQALLYETMVELGRKGEYVRVNGQVQFISRVAEGIAALVGGLLATIAFVWPFVGVIVLYVIALFVAFSFTEPKRARHVGDHLPHLVNIFVDSLHRNRLVKWVLAFSIVTALATHVSFWLYQPLFIELGLSYVWFGVLWAAILGVVGAVSYFAHLIDERLSRMQGFALVLLIALVGFFGIAFTGPTLGVLVFAFILQASRGLQVPLVDDELNRLVSDDRRATVFSIRSMIHKIIYAPAMPLVGYVATGNLFFAFLAVGIAVLVLGGGIWMTLSSLKAAQ